MVVVLLPAAVIIKKSNFCVWKSVRDCLILGNNFFYGPDFLLEQDVILVTMNYRLGAFGFMSLNTKSYSGNMGLKDQQMALKWTHRNIRHFNGNRQQITLVGHSAGNRCVCVCVCLTLIVSSFWLIVFFLGF